MTGDVVTLAHGAGGKATRDLVEGVFLPALDNPALAALGDSAVFRAGGARLALTTDAFVVRPLEFPGGDIGELAVNGTVNDLAVAGARPVALSAALVLEEGVDLALVRRIARSAAGAAARAGVPVVAGDTKVVEHGAADGLYVTTAGVGVFEHTAPVGPAEVRAGDRVLLSGTIADHGIAVLVARGELDLEADVESDTAPLTELAAALLGLRSALRFMRDPTRGGLATALNEVARASGTCIAVEEALLPVAGPVRAACEILGIDPLYVANEGKLVAVVAPDAADTALALLRSHPLGANAAIVGEVREGPAGIVVMETLFGSSRVVDMLVGDPLPRIC